MDIYSTLGTGFVIYMVCAGIAAHVKYVYHGNKRLKQLQSDGEMREDKSRVALQNEESLFRPEGKLIR